MVTSGAVHRFRHRDWWRRCVKVQSRSTDQAEANTSASTRSSGPKGGGAGARVTEELQPSDYAEVREDVLLEPVEERICLREAGQVEGCEPPRGVAEGPATRRRQQVAQRRRRRHSRRRGGSQGPRSQGHQERRRHVQRRGRGVLRARPLVLRGPGRVVLVGVGGLEGPDGHDRRARGSTGHLLARCEREAHTKQAPVLRASQH